MDKVDQLVAAPAIPGDIHSMAAEIVKQMSSAAGFAAKDATRLQDIVTKTLLERIAVVDDVRMGRIMGSAIAMI